MNSVSLVAELPGHDDRAWAVAWNPSRPILASCSADKSVRLYSYSSSALKFDHVTTIPTGHAKTVRSIAWSPSGKTLATGSFDSNIGIWEQENVGEDELGAGEWECMTILEGHETECKGVAYSSTGTLLASCSRDKTVWVWEVHPDADFECLGVMMEHSQDVKCVAWHPSEEILASGSYDDTIKLHIDDPTEDWYCFTTLIGHTSTVWSLAWSPKGSYLASASDDKTVRIWRRTEQYKWETVLTINAHDRTIYAVSWSKGRPKSGAGGLGWLATAGGDGSIKIWELTEETGSEPSIAHCLIAVLPSAHGVHDVNAISWCPREGMEDVFATTGDDGVTKVWRVVPGE
ncbi:hypothetical protein AGABI1DRAFT_132063 [Agaricus bisporus var. burnettii JB137-S8]|uniref:Probable cytosolic iron-sulfur protein assembly protein 1 n=1 Tax=Agaricus bisporus var. burnettii (strain JB137-S8 / ATCC MYA-4627 / FGSC 10392) TaxID=597362 RepID=K5WK67_AGABU|nr:uncharacterized protein AGABI1DRAFT_132063 [Agaricus bisporus var. burnettii JB137-S8]EKM75671.1 hypothetical protein AGABI1DRAFT_132063 [Agaricus bisporus var. burnettii JB137-S8]